MPFIIYSEQLWPSLPLRQLRVWASPREILGIQAGYDLPIEEKKDQLWWAPAHRGSTSPTSASVPPTAILTLAPGERLVSIEIETHEHGVGALLIQTSLKQQFTVGKAGGAAAGPSKSTTTVIKLDDGWEALAFFGTINRSGGLHSLGLTKGRFGCAYHGHLATLSLPSHPWGVYTSCALTRATRHMLQWNADAASSSSDRSTVSSDTYKNVICALKAASRYLQNCVKEPANPKYRLIRCRSKYFYDNIGKLAGSGDLMAALGFQHVAAAVAESEADTAAEAEACYQLSLAKVSPATMEALIVRLGEVAGLLEQQQRVPVSV